MKGINRLDDHSRVQRVVSELNLKNIDRKFPNKNISITNNATQMIIDYSNELAISILEASCLMAKHRNSKSIEIDDVNIILAKKLGIELPYNKVAIELSNKDNNTIASYTINNNNYSVVNGTTSSNVIQNDDNNNRKRKFTKFFDDKSETMMLSDQNNSVEATELIDKNQSTDNCSNIIQIEQNN